MKKVIKMVLFVLIFVIIIEFVSALFLPIESVKKYGFLKTAFFEISQEEPDTIDVIALGDSIFYNSISPMEIWNEYGYTTYVCATPGELASVSYEHLKIAIEQEHPKLVLFSANVLFRDKEKQPIYIKLKNIVKYYLPIFQIHDEWKKISMNDKLNIYKGYKHTERVNKAPKIDNMKETNKRAKVPEDNINYLKKIKELCDKNNVRLVMLSIPSLTSWNSKKHNSVMDLSKELDIEFIDLNKSNEVKIDWNKETKDKGDHLNNKGAKKITKWLGKYISETGIIENHKNDKKYASWNEAYELYKNQFNK